MELRRHLGNLDYNILQCSRAGKIPYCIHRAIYILETCGIRKIFSQCAEGALFDRPPKVVWLGAGRSVWSDSREVKHCGSAGLVV